MGCLSVYGRSFCVCEFTFVWVNGREIGGNGMNSKHICYAPKFAVHSVTKTAIRKLKKEKKEKERKEQNGMNMVDALKMRMKQEKKEMKMVEMKMKSETKKFEERG